MAQFCVVYWGTGATLSLDQQRHQKDNQRLDAYIARDSCSTTETLGSVPPGATICFLTLIHRVARLGAEQEEEEEILFCETNNRNDMKYAYNRN